MEFSFVYPGGCFLLEAAKKRNGPNLGEAKAAKAP